MEADYTFSFTTGVFGCEDLDDPFYLSKSVASAEDIVLDRQYKLLPSCGGKDNMHHFKFTLEEATKIRDHYKVVYADTANPSWRFYFLRADGLDYSGQGAGIDVAGQYEYEAAYSFLPGTYYVKTGKTYYTGHTAVYEILLETATPCEDDIYEDNDFFDQATPVSEGLIHLRGCSVDKDYFSIDLSAGETLVVTLDHETPPEADYRMTGYNAMKQERARYQGYAHSSSISMTVTADETHCVDVFFWPDNNTYSLNFEVTGP
jgi:hypothetical protein